MHHHYCCQGFFGAAAGKAKQAAKTEVEKLKMADMTCEQIVKEAAKMWVIALMEFKLLRYSIMSLPCCALRFFKL